MAPIRHWLRAVLVPLLVLAVALGPSCAPVPPPLRAAIPAPPRRLALVIGNGAYEAVPKLANPPNDAKAVAERLERLGFTTQLLLDADRPAFQTAVNQFAAAAAGADTAVLFYAGHAVDVGGRNYLLPVGVAIQNGQDVPEQALGLNDVLTDLEGKARRTLVLLDACRDDPFSGVPPAPAERPRNASSPAENGMQQTRSIGPGLASVASGAGMLVAFATAPGHVALDGAGSHSPFTTSLLHHLADPNVEVRQMLGSVRRDVRMATDNQQVPWDNSSLEEAVYLNQTLAPRTALSGPTPFDGTWRGESDLWKITMQISNGHIQASIDSCFGANGDRRWQPNGPPVEGSIDASGRISASTVPVKGKEGWITRVVRGTLPDIAVLAVNAAPERVNCPNGTVTMQRL